MTTVFYELPANELHEGVSTDDGQDILGAEISATGVLATVYTPRPDDPDIDEDNRKGLLHDQVTVSVTRPDWPVWS